MFYLYFKLEIEYSFIMAVEGKMSYINLNNLEAISRGDKSRMQKYLRQFLELIPDRSNQLRKALLNEDRVQLRQILHKMSPQLQFFGIQDIIVPIQRLEFEYQTMPHEELTRLINEIISKLEGAINEVSRLIDSKF